MTSLGKSLQDPQAWRPAGTKDCRGECAWHPGSVCSPSPGSEGGVRQGTGQRTSWEGVWGGEQQVEPALGCFSWLPCPTLSAADTTWNKESVGQGKPGRTPWKCLPSAQPQKHKYKTPGRRCTPGRSWELIRVCAKMWVPAWAPLMQMPLPQLTHSEFKVLLNSGHHGTGSANDLHLCTVPHSPSALNQYPDLLRVTRCSRPSCSPCISPLSPSLCSMHTQRAWQKGAAAV